MIQKFLQQSLPAVACCLMTVTLLQGSDFNRENLLECTYSAVQDTFPLKDRQGDFINDPNKNPYDLNDPGAIEQNVEYDPETGNYIIYESIGEGYYRAPTYMTFEEYMQWRTRQQERQYFHELSGLNAGGPGGGDVGGFGLLDPVRDIDIENLLIDRLFGGTDIQITPRGNVDLIFGYDYQRVLNNNIPIRAQRQGNFDFDMNINMSVDARIGKKLNLNFNYNTGATFDFDNQMKLDYNSAEFSEDDILKRIEAGNVSLPLRNSLIQGSQSLFGILAELQFGRLRLTTLVSQQRSRRQQIQLQGGAQIRQFEVFSDQYDEFRHFFLSHYNRNTFEQSLQNLPQIRSQFKVQRIEVFVTNIRQEVQQTRDIVAIADLGEPSNFTIRDSANFKPPTPRHLDPGTGLPLPGKNIINDVYANDILAELERRGDADDIDRAVAVLQSPPFNFAQGRDFEKVNARQLRPTEFDFHPELGFLSLNIQLRPDQVLAVAYEYDFNGKTYRVGQFSNEHYSGDSTKVLFLKLLRGTTPNVGLPTWDLMMKNIYSIGAYQATREDFQLDVFYDDPGGGQKRFLPALPKVPLLQLFNLDNLNVQGDPAPDGVFDFVPGLTIFPRSGRIMFPVLEPFGSSLARQLPDDPQIQQEYVYQTLYDSTVWRAREYPALNRFIVRGEYKSSVSSEISLGAFNLPEGSVIVRAGGQQLREGIDYEVDYGLGRVRITNDAYLTSGVPINISFEDNTLFGIQQQTLLGLRADYMASKKLNIGGTYMHLFERPFTQKVNIGDDPISNRVYGLDLNYNTEAPWLTKAVDWLPFISTKAPSNFALTTEFAALDPGHARAINQGQEEDGGRDKSGVVYLDDFEGSTTSDDLRLPTTRWILASTPQQDGPNPLYPEANLINDPLGNVNRAKLSWYRVDLTLRDAEDDADPYTRLVRQTEIFKNVNLQPTQNDFINTLDLTFFPSERGPYNYDLPDGTPFSAGLELENGQNRPKLRDPQSRWGGIMRAINNTNFQQANYEFIEFWLLNPFMFNRNGTVAEQGDLYINLGNISEDVTRDSRLFSEVNLPLTPEERQPDTTNLGFVGRKQLVINAFDQENDNRQLQDVGFDGMNDEEERWLLQDYVNAISAVSPNQQIIDYVESDPANDNYECFRLEDNEYRVQDPDITGVFRRYFNFNNPHGNSPVVEAGTRLPCNSTALPDIEDLNQDFSLNETEAYYEYKIPLRRGASTDDGYALDIRNSDIERFVTDTVQGATGTWYRFKIPIRQFTGKVGNIQDFQSIRFIRMFMTGFDEPTTLRFARLELVRSQWRSYLRPLEPRPVSVCTNTDASFDINDVNIEENGDRAPFNYVLPNGIEREQGIGAFPDALQNEQSLALTVCDLPCGDGRAVYKNINYDMRVYERLKMFIHAEVTEKGRPANRQVQDGDASVFIRIGSDFTRNYYEYEIPLTFSKEENIMGIDPADEEYIDEVWRMENEFDFPLELLRQIKLQRNEDGVPNILFSASDPEKPNNTVRIIGNPNLGYVRTIMIGVRNNTEFTFAGKCVEIWANEMRLAGLDERTAIAALSRVDMQLADLGNVNLEANYSSIGYGSIAQKVNERAREEIISYNITADLELGRFLGEKAGISIPFLAQYFQETRNPEFDPYDFDIPLKEKLDNADSPEQRDSIRTLAQDFSRITSISFNNVRKQRTGQGAVMPWDVSNFSFTYGLTNTFRRTPLIEREEERIQNFGIQYGYQMKPLTIAPFKKLIKKDKYFKWLSELNFNLIPNSVGISSDIERSFRVTKYRFTGIEEEAPSNTFFNKYFIWDRRYNVNWDMARNLKFNFNAIANSVIDEPQEFDPVTEERITDRARRDSIWNNIKNLGRPKNYTHEFAINYSVPMQNFPFLDWIDIKGQYNASYSWSAAPLNLDSLGNVITNSQRRQVNGDLNFESLYNKSSYLRKINRRSRAGGISRGRRGLGNRNSSRDESRGDKKKKSKSNEPGTFEKVLLRPLMMLRKVRFTYSEDLSTVVPGFLPQPELMGLSTGFDAPGWNFIAGLQPEIRPGENDWLRMAANEGWMSESYWVNQQVLQNYTQTIDAQITVEPFNDFRIQISANRQYTDNLSLFFRDSLADNYTDPSEIVHLSPRVNGSFSVSYNGLNTLFGTDPDALFEAFEANRIVISQRLNPDGQLHENNDLASQGYRQGYGELQQDVLVNSFLATYNGQDPGTWDLITGKDDFKGILPRLNWQVSYNGLARLPGLKDIFSGFNLNHGYRSTLTINNFQTDAEAAFGGQGNFNPNQDFYPAYVIPNITINEQFSPLLGLDMKFRNDLSLRLDFQTARNLAFSFVDYKLLETKRTNYVVGFGYVLKNFRLPFFESAQSKNRRTREENNNNAPPGGQQQDNSKDLRLQFDFSYGDDISLVHLLDQQGEPQETRGARRITFNPAAEYELNEQLSLRFFFDYTRTIPYTTQAFPITNWQTGLNVRFSLN